MEQLSAHFFSRLVGGEKSLSDGPMYPQIISFPDRSWANSRLHEPNFSSFSASLIRSADLWLNSISLILAHQARWLLRSNLLLRRLLLQGSNNLTQLYHGPFSQRILFRYWQSRRRCQPAALDVSCTNAQVITGNPTSAQRRPFSK